MAESDSNFLKNLVVVVCAIVVASIAVGGVLIACGSVVGDIDTNKNNIVDLTATQKIHAKEIVQGKLNDQKQQALSANTLNVLSSLNTNLEAIKAVQNTQATDIALIKQKLEGKNNGS